MSHFFTLIIMPKDSKKSEYKAIISDLMEPFDEGKEVEAYFKQCWCVGRKARDFAQNKVWEDLDQIRKDFHEKYKGYENQDEIWKTQIWSPRNKIYESLLATHPLKEAPDTECEECKGTGKYETTYNPKSKWDWYVIGGRYDGVVKNNYQSSENGFNFGEQHHSLENNTASIQYILDNEILPFAILTPEGEWIEKGEMGWWGIVFNEKDCDISDKELTDTLTKYKDNYVVGLDCHI